MRKSILSYINSLFCVLLLLLVFESCSNDDLPEIIDDEGNYPSGETNSGLEDLKEACDNGNIISSILFLPASSNGDIGARWLVAFTDGNSINVLCHKDIITPFLRVNNEGYWTVAYDGKTFVNIEGETGEYIGALAEDIDVDNPSQEETDILCMAPWVDTDGNLSFESYRLSSPEYIIDTVNAKVSLPKDMEIVGIVQNDFTGYVSFYTYGNEPLLFEYKNRRPYSFGIVDSEETLFKSPGDSVVIEFFVSPSNVDFGLETSNPLVDLSMDYLNGQDAKNYSSYPVAIKEIMKATDESGIYIPGRYRVVLEDVGDNLFTYDEPVVLSIKYLGVDRENLSISTEIFNLRYDSDSPLIIKSDIPVIKIKSPSAINSKDIWTENCEIEVLNAGKYNNKYSKVQIKGRGNSTWSLPKKPYAIKLDKKDGMLGLPKHKRWVLLANYYDKTNLRNEISFYMGRLSAGQTEPGLEYNPRSSFARLFFNEKFQGLYQFTEQLKVDENRVDVGDDGYLLEIDFRATEEKDNIYFRIPHIDNYIVVKDPDIESQSDLDYIKDFMTKADEALFSDNFRDPEEGFRKYIDVNSFVDWYLINEITKNADANFWTSCYMNVARGGKLRMGPLWDFDLAAGNYQNFGDWWYTQWINDPKDFHIKNVPWYDRMFKDPEFVKVLKHRFQYYFERQSDIYKELDKQKELILPLIEENEKIWFFFTKPFDATVSSQAFNSDCEELKSWLQQRFDWLKKEYDKL